MMRIQWTLLAVIWLVGLAQGDVVILRDGRALSGEVKHDGDRVTIRTADGDVEVASSEIQRIVPALATTSPTAPTSQAPSSAHEAWVANEGNEPEAVIFATMRRLMSTPPGVTSAQLRQNIEQYRIMAHDRKRKFGKDWLAPEEIARRREYYQTLVKQAPKPTAHSPAGTPANRGAANKEKEQAAQQREAQLAMNSAAQAWPDETLRALLLGLAAYQANDFRRADGYFRELATAWPMVAAFHQASALALLEVNQPLEALAAAMRLLEMRPSDRDAAALVERCVHAAPGSELRNPLVVRAKEAVSHEEKPTARPSASLSLMMPGKPWPVRPGILPVPPYDRLIVRQAIAVPVAKNTLLVDSSLAKADELYIVVEGRLTPARIARSGSKTGELLVAISSADCNFEPLAVGDAAPDDRNATLLHLTLHPKGATPPTRSVPRSSDCHITKAPPEMTLGDNLAPGEVTSPILVGHKLVGFAAGRTDAFAEMGGPVQIVPASQLADTLTKTKRSNPSSSRPLAQAKQAAVIPTVKGDYFVVLAIFGEKLE